MQKHLARSLILFSVLLLATAVVFAQDEEAPEGEGEATETTETTEEAVPAGETTTEEAQDTGNQDLGNQTYIVQRGDTLDTIAQDFDIALESLRLVNDLVDNSDIFPGDSLIIPGDVPAYGETPLLVVEGQDTGGGIGGGVEGDVYIVQVADTLDEIAQEFDVSLDVLLEVNAIEFGRDLRVGQSIVIPAGAPPYGTVGASSAADSEGGGVGGGAEGEVYVIQVGDTIDQVGADFNADVACILEANGITNSRQVFPGDTVVVPIGCPAYTGVAIPRTTTDAANAG